MVYVHPTFLYESLWNILGFVLINIFYRHKKYDGQIMLMVFGWYGLGRMLIEGHRMDSLWTGPFGLITLIFLVILLAAVGFVMYYAPSIIKNVKEKNIGNSEKIRYISITGAMVVSLIMIVLDVSVIHSVTVIKEQRVSQVLAALIFIVCSVMLIYFMIRKPDRPLYYKEKTEKKSKSK
jgi:prolipoprotein diacylglyceryltransferase